MQLTSDTVFRLIPITLDGEFPGHLDCGTDSIGEMVDATKELYAKEGYRPPWIGYLSSHDGMIVGGGSFVGGPRDGAVEIAYFTLPQWRSQGYALRTARALIDVVRLQSPHLGVIAKTLPESGASTRILERLGFRRAGSVRDHEVGEAWLWRV